MKITSGLTNLTTAILILTVQMFFEWTLVKFVTQSRTGLQIYEGHDDELNRPGPMA
jgi:hypothetical protein